MIRLLAIAGVTVGLLGLAPASDEPATPVRTGRVIRRDVARGKIFIGTVEPARKSVVGSAVAGRVEGVFVEEGDLVDPADPIGKGELVQLRLNTVQITLRSAQAGLEVSKHELAELLKGPRDEELRRLEALVKGAEAAHEYTSKKFKRLQQLFGRDAAALAKLDEALSEKLAAEQHYLAAKADYEAALSGTREEKLAQAEARVAQAQEEVNRLEDQLADHTIRAPFRGYVVLRQAEKGEWIQPGSPIAEIVELDPVEVRLAVPEEFITRVHEGMKVRVDVASIQRDVDGILMGTVFRVVPSADARSRSFPVRIRIENPAHTGPPLLKPGMLARVQLPVSRAEETLLIPKDALVLDRDTATLFVVDRQGKQSTVREVAIDVGSARDKLIQVRPKAGGNLSVGMAVVTEGNERLKAGQAVQILD